VLFRHVGGRRRQGRVALPPVDADRNGLFDGRDKQPQPDAEELYADKTNGYVARDHHAVVENALENVRQCRALHRVLHASIRHDVLSDSLWMPAHGGEAVIRSTTAAVFSRSAAKSRPMRPVRLLFFL